MAVKIWCKANSDFTSVLSVIDIPYPCIESGEARGFCAFGPICHGLGPSLQKLGLGQHFREFREGSCVFVAKPRVKLAEGVL
jgi:hypothetical protein